MDDFRLAADRDEVGDPLQREKVSVKRANQKISKITVRSAGSRRRSDSNTDLLYLLRDLGCDLAEQVVVEQPGRFGRVVRH